nr:type III secretion system gatekeeper subunit SctW [Pseudomonas sp. MWU13-3659]
MFSSLVNARLNARNRITDTRRHGARAGSESPGMLKQVPDIQRRALDALVAQLRQHPTLTARELAAHLKGLSSEVCHQYLALAHARAELAKGPGSEALLKLLDNALAQMEQKHGRAIALGLEIGPLAAQAAEQGAGEVGELRNVYRDFVTGYRGLAHAWGELRGRFGDARVDEVSKFLVKGLAAHLMGLQGGRDNDKLQLVIGDMKLVQILKKLEEDVEQFFERVLNRKRKRNKHKRHSRDEHDEQAREDDNDEDGEGGSGVRIF